MPPTRRCTDGPRKRLDGYAEGGGGEEGGVFRECGEDSNSPVKNKSQKRKLPMEPQELKNVFVGGIGGGALGTKRTAGGVFVFESNYVKYRFSFFVTKTLLLNSSETKTIRIQSYRRNDTLSLRPGYKHEYYMKADLRV